jgi:hypothetical protein
MDKKTGIIPMGFKSEKMVKPNFVTKVKVSSINYFLDEG